MREFIVENGGKRVEESEIRKLYHNNSSELVSVIIHDALQGVIGSEGVQ